MNEDKEPTIIEHQENHNCNVFTGPIYGGVFPLPGSTVNYCPTEGKCACDESDNKALASKELLNRNERICRCVEQLYSEGYFHRKYYYGAVCEILKESGIYEGLQYKAFAEMLKDGCQIIRDDLPSNSSIDKLEITGKYPKWIVKYKQPKDNDAMLAVAKRFLELFNE